MSYKTEAIPGLYNIECAICGVTVKSNQIRLTEETRVPICLEHTYYENFNRPQIVIKPAKVPTPSREAEDVFTTYDTPEEG